MNAAPASQTLSRGISILETLAERSPLSIDEIAHELSVHRSVAYRLVRTLEQHRLVVRDSSGLCTLGPQLNVLAAGVNRDLQSAASTEVNALAHELGFTSFFGMLDGTDFVTLVSAAPRTSGATLAQQPGSRHPLTVGAPSKAVLAGMPERDWPVEVRDALLTDVRGARERGWAESHDEVIPTVTSIAVGLPLIGGVRSAIAILAMRAHQNPAVIAERLRASANTIAGQLGR